MCVPCQTSAATGTSFDQRRNKASGVPVERGVLVKLQTWQHRGPSYCKLTNDPKTGNWGLVEMNLPKNRNTCQHRGVRPPRPLRKHTLNPNHCNSEVSWKYIYITPGKCIMSGKTVGWIDYDPLENIHPVKSQTWGSVQTAQSKVGPLWKRAQHEDRKVEDTTDDREVYPCSKPSWELQHSSPTFMWWIDDW